MWHDSTSLGDVDAVVLPGGFAYGDYLRCGAIAKFSPVMTAVKKFAADGGPVLGVFRENLATREEFLTLVGR